jgi:hypothetical protein
MLEALRARIIPMICKSKFYLTIIYDLIIGILFYRIEDGDDCETLGCCRSLKLIQQIGVQLI